MASRGRLWPLEPMGRAVVAWPYSIDLIPAKQYDLNISTINWSPPQVFNPPAVVRGHAWLSLWDGVAMYYRFFFNAGVGHTLEFRFGFGPDPVTNLQNVSPARLIYDGVDQLDSNWGPYPNIAGRITDFEIMEWGGGSQLTLVPRVGAVYILSGTPRATAVRWH